jgi:peptidoglycan/xylan/chitin deacetylase (PgdA/CDA1 family)
MTWAMAEELTERGHVFGSHTVTHPHLTALDEEALREELVVARARLRERLGACDTLAYPFGEWDGRVAAAAADAGYRYAFTLPHGAQRFATALSLPRLPVDHRDGAVRFSIKLLPAYRRLALSPLKGALRQLRRRA